MHLGDNVKVADREIALSDRHDEPKREKEQLVEPRRIQSINDAFIVSFSLSSPLGL